MKNVINLIRAYYVYWFRGDIHSQIRYLLERGCKVYSFAWGRVGEIVYFSNGANDIVPIIICSQSRPHNKIKQHRHIHGATTFLAGDPVMLHYNKKRNYYQVLNNKDGLK